MRDIWLSHASRSGTRRTQYHLCHGLVKNAKPQLNEDASDKNKIRNVLSKRRVEGETIFFKNAKVIKDKERLRKRSSKRS